MGTAEVQGELWGARARDWAEAQEPVWRLIYEAFFSRAGPVRGAKLLDVGCGAGGALTVARRLGADVTGFDASVALTAVARERLPGARIEVGDMEALPFEDTSFDIVTGFNSFQFPGDIPAAFREARRVVRADGKVAVLVWGRREDCELVSGVMPAVMALLPPSPTTASTPFDFGSPGVLESIMEKGGLAPKDSGDLDGVLEYPDAATATRAVSSAGPSTRAARHAGEAAVNAAIGESLRRFTRADGSVTLKNRFRFVVARRA